MIPSYEDLMLPVLKLCSENTWPMQGLVAAIADHLSLTEEERSAQIPSGMPVISSRVHWAKSYLKQAGLLQQPKRAYVEISELGRALLTTSPDVVNVATLKKYPAFLAFLSRTKQGPGKPLATKENDDSGLFPQIALDSAPNSATPDEQIEQAALALLEELRDALLARILEASPAFFERLIIDLLLAMGYGGSRAEAADQLGGTGDGGVDGVIREDQLGLDRIYLQAKRYAPGNSVGSEAVQAFMGALYGKGAQKGVLITTSSFSKQAQTVASHVGALRIVLIDGDELTRLMVRFNVGVRTARTVEIKRVDLDYFEGLDLE